MYSPEKTNEKLFNEYYNYKGLISLRDIPKFSTWLIVRIDRAYKRKSRDGLAPIFLDQCWYIVFKKSSYAKNNIRAPLKNFFYPLLAIFITTTFSLIPSQIILHRCLVNSFDKFLLPSLPDPENI